MFCLQAVIGTNFTCQKSHVRQNEAKTVKSKKVFDKSAADFRSLEPGDSITRCKKSVGTASGFEETELISYCNGSYCKLSMAGYSGVINAISENFSPYNILAFLFEFQKPLETIFGNVEWNTSLLLILLLKQCRFVKPVIIFDK